jgi:RNA polymerase-binding transcription factor
MAAKQIRNAAGLSDEQLEILRDRLERIRAELRVRIARESAVSRETEKLVEPLEAAEQTREQDDAISMAEHDREHLREIEHAIYKMSTGLYGISEISGEPIPYARLHAIPWARHDSDEVEESAGRSP